MRRHDMLRSLAPLLSKLAGKRFSSKSMQIYKIIPDYTNRGTHYCTHSARLFHLKML